MKILKKLEKFTFHKDNNIILITIPQKYQNTKNLIQESLVRDKDFFQRIDAKVQINVESNAKIIF
jgi:hypothetical protein